MIIMNSKYYPPHVMHYSYSHDAVLSTVAQTGVYCESIVNGYDPVKSHITYVNNDGSMFTIEV